MPYNNPSPMEMENPELQEKKFSVLQEITNAIVLTNNISAIANLMLNLAINYTDAEKGSFMLVNEKDELYILAAKGIDIQFIKTYRIKVGEGIAGTVAKKRQPVLIEDIDSNKEFNGKKRDRYRTRSFISCPIVSKNKLLGVLNINDKKDFVSFTEDEFSLIKIITNQAAIVLENAFLLNQLRSRTAELENINSKLANTETTRTEFITRVSCELRTPLNSISGAVYYLKKHENIEQKEKNDFYDIVSNETDKLIYTVENLLDFLRLEDETRVIKKTMIKLPDLLKEILNSKSLNSMLAKKNLKLELDIKEDISDIIGDKIRVNQFFINMVDGLIYFLEKGDTIRIAVNEDNFVEIDITIPRKIPESVRPQLFNSGNFFKPEQPEELLKLYLVNKVAEVHKWGLNAENTRSGFLVSITIPKSKREKTELAINRTMDIFIEFMSELLGLDKCSIMLSDELTEELTIKSAVGLDDSVIKNTRIRFGDKIAGWVAHEGKPLLIEDIEYDARFAKKNVSQYNTKSLISLPLKVQDKVIGVLNLNNKKTGDTFTTQDLSVASIVSERISRFMEKIQSGECSENDFNKFITAFNDLLNAKKKYSKNGTVFPGLIIEVMNILGAKEEDKNIALYITKIYDLGLALIDDSVLKKDKLSTSDSRALKIHPSTTVSLLSEFEFSEDVKRVILYHHEKYDGTGYDKLKGNEIPFISRVLSVIDAFCAMVSERPYRKAFSKKEALQEIKKGSGSAYDPEVVNALEKVLTM